jgi:tripartite ATP-independent transporter DctM subunit
MNWQVALVIIFGSLLVVMFTGLPVAFCFFLLDMIGMFILFGGLAGLEQFILSMYSSVVDFNLIAIPLFILMGELLFRSGTANNMIDVVDSWLGKLPGRLSLVAIMAGTLFSTLTGSSTATTSMMGSVLVPEMEKRGYSKDMSLGPIMGSGALAPMIPPSNLAVLVGSIGLIPIGGVLIAIIGPGLLMALLYFLYVFIRTKIQPSLAPAYDVSAVPMAIKLKKTAYYVFPIIIIIFLVTGLIFFGIATPSEAAASGCLGVFVITFVYRNLNFKVIKDSVIDTLRISGMVLLIIATSRGLSQIVSFTGAGNGLTALVSGLPVVPIVTIIAMMIVIAFLGCFISYVAIMMITLPTFVPIVAALHYDPIWFAALFMINIEAAFLTPPFGINLYVMKGVASKTTTMGDVIRASLPYLACDVLVIVLVMAFPQIAMWLPGMMGHS